MPLTFTGRSIKPDNGTHPSLLDIAVSLSRMPRFAGHTRRWWSVLDHSLFCDELVLEEREATRDRRLYRIAMLLHDAHESVTGDVPTTFKSPALRIAQDSLDVWIADAFFPGGYPIFRGWESSIKEIDKRALVAEAAVVGPPHSPAHLPAFGLGTAVPLEQYNKDVTLLNRLLARGHYFGIPPVIYPASQADHPAVQEYLTRLMELL